MINLPNSPGTTNSAAGSSPATAAGVATQEVKAADLARQNVSEVIRAVVIQAKLLPSTGSGKTSYEILLQASPARLANTAPPVQREPVSQITSAVMNGLRLDQSFIIKTQAEFLLQPGTQVQATVNTQQGVVINRVFPPAIANTVNAVLRELVPSQSGLTPLFQMLEQLQNQPSLSQNKTLQALRPALLQLLQVLPKLEQLQGPRQMQSAIRDSGVFFENKLAQQVDTTQSQPNKGSGSASGNTPPDITQWVRRISAALQNKAMPREQPQATTPGQLVKAEQSATMNPTGNDLKQALNNLQQRLQQSATTTPTNTTATNPDKVNAAATQSTYSPALKGPANINTDSKAAQGVTPPIDSDSRTARGQTQNHTTDQQLRTIIRNSAQPDSHASERGNQPRTHSQTAPVGGDIRPTPANVAENLLLPPLPGHIPLQPQARSKMSGGAELADALVSVLLKQVKGAIDRMTLHQLASQPRSQDPGAPAPLLSFELPILHQQQVQVFQFLIEEQEADTENEHKQMAKRWVVQMAFDIEGLGPMLCQISMVQQSASVSFWAEWENTLQHTRQHFDYLQQVLQDMGIKVEKLQAHLGIPKSEQAILQNQLVDIRT